MNYKYCIREKIEQLPISFQVKIKNEISVALGKCQATFNNYCHIKANDSKGIGSINLDIIAFYLDCTADDLKNFYVKNNKVYQKTAIN